MVTLRRMANSRTSGREFAAGDVTTCLPCNSCEPHLYKKKSKDYSRTLRKVFGQPGHVGLLRSIGPTACFSSNLASNP